MHQNIKRKNKDFHEQKMQKKSDGNFSSNCSDCLKISKKKFNYLATVQTLKVNTN